ncbi:hypothetical protein M3649_03640 [Ureibacillus chungkukjangi]|uniref:hypothetical protein n=1 Tax=Ureibacillus chungkukjangi TaxID=1202712 RepID=UPI0020422F33|nr:hypothetical protein [Ureibacillus chungkukjangi]MCM3387223.1 hypothetical protein [Ureibacillus chungkukjangi]
MFVRVFFPFSNSNAAYDYVSENELRKGEIVVVNENDQEKIGIVYFLENKLPCFDKIKGVVIRKANSIDVFDFWREFEKALLDKGVGLSYKAYNSYMMTNGNFNTPLEIAEKKLTRNLLLCYKSNRVYITHDKCMSLQYGAMRIYYKNGVIHKIENHTNCRSWKKNEIGYTYYSKLLGIEGL